MFDKISKDWNRKRRLPWKLMTEWALKAISRWELKCNQNRNHCLFIDIGAGSGRHTTFFQENSKNLIELDASFNMLRENISNSQKIHASMDFIPLRDNQFDGIFSIAAIHHIQGKQNRSKVLKEIHRIGNSAALIGLTLWRFYQDKFQDDFKKQLLNCDLPNITSEIGDVIVPWTISQSKDTITVPRFYHLFRSSEFHEFISPFACILKGTLGNKKRKTNFFFFGLNSKKIKFTK